MDLLIKHFNADEKTILKCIEEAAKKNKVKSEEVMSTLIHKSQGVFELEKLPNEVLYKILEETDMISLIGMCSTSTKLRTFCKHWPSLFLQTEYTMGKTKISRFIKLIPPAKMWNAFKKFVEFPKTLMYFGDIEKSLVNMEAHYKLVPFLTFNVQEEDSLEVDIVEDYEWFINIRVVYDDLFLERTLIYNHDDIVVPDNPTGSDWKAALKAGFKKAPLSIHTRGGILEPSEFAKHTLATWIP